MNYTNIQEAVNLTVKDIIVLFSSVLSSGLKIEQSALGIHIDYYKYFELAFEQDGELRRKSTKTNYSIANRKRV